MFVLECLASALTMLGFALMAQNWLGFGLPVAVIANIVWLVYVWAHPYKMKGLAIVNIFMLVAGLIGIVKLIGS